MSNRYPKYSKYSTREVKKNKSLYDRVVTLYKNIKRVLKIANKPSRKDYFDVFKIVVIGLALIGGINYVIQLLFQIIPL
ncbi:MAG: protein translocase SEC61 complex subunit gamma [Candidatus Lokiarchaeota archaeon]